MSKLIQKGSDQFLWSIGKCALCGGEPVLRLNLCKDPYDGNEEGDVYACTECCERTVGRILTNFEGWRERLADVVHNIWSHWMRHFLSAFKNTTSTLVRYMGPSEGDSTEGFGKRAATLKFIDGCVERWERQMETPYSRLSEEERESDLEQADKILAALGVKAEPVEVRYVGVGAFTSARLQAKGPHDEVRIWNRGGLAGALVLNRGDGVALLTALGMSREET